MDRNIEIKARIPSVEALALRIAGIASEGPSDIQQDDTFFHCPEGRLKLRSFGDGSAELIFYRRPDQAGPKESLYLRSAVEQPNARQIMTALAIDSSQLVEASYADLLRQLRDGDSARA
jgi:adenylate cyclase class IV